MTNIIHPPVEPWRGHNEDVLFNEAGKTMTPATENQSVRLGLWAAGLIAAGVVIGKLLT